MQLFNLCPSIVYDMFYFVANVSHLMFRITPALASQHLPLVLTTWLLAAKPGVLDGL